MKKFLALTLALLMVVCLFAACGKDSKATDPAETDGGSSGTGERKGPVLAETEATEGDIFGIVLLDNGSVFWNGEEKSPQALVELCDIGDPPHANIQIINDGDITMYIVADEEPDWTDDEMIQTVWDAYDAYLAGEPGTAGSNDVVHMEEVELIEAENDHGKLFAAVVDQDGKVYVADDSSEISPAAIAEANKLTVADVVLLQFVHREGGNIWQMEVIGTAIPGWFDGGKQQMAWNAFDEWATADSGDSGGPDDGGGPQE